MGKTFSPPSSVSSYFINIYARGVEEERGGAEKNGKTGRWGERGERDRYTILFTSAPENLGALKTFLPSYRAVNLKFSPPPLSLSFSLACPVQLPPFSHPGEGKPCQFFYLAFSPVQFWF